jgi:hypothetical protein
MVATAIVLSLLANPNADAVAKIELGMPLAEVQQQLAVDRPLELVGHPILGKLDRQVSRGLNILLGLRQYRFPTLGAFLSFDGEDRVMRITLRDPFPLPVEGVSVGDTVEMLIAKRGMPSRLDLDANGYVYGEGRERVVYFTAHEVVTEIQIGAQPPRDYWIPSGS